MAYQGSRQPRPTQPTGNVPPQPGFSRSPSDIPINTAGENTPFDLVKWRLAHEKCLKYFLDFAQYQESVQALCAFMNISLPFQRSPTPVTRYVMPPKMPPSPGPPGPLGPSPPRFDTMQSSWVSLTPYIRRMVVTGWDRPGPLEAMFGPEWVEGLDQTHEVERRNYLFAVKGGTWSGVKEQYDMGPHETVPYLWHPYAITESELSNAEGTWWSQWIAFRDWQVGPRAHENLSEMQPSQP
ncbi:MAG: hypothetical protein M1825_003391 [Sarcosagium campestre]|nr:MAG: hypothetical protein M1825_003391 [Sarcosagium campestre]